MDGERLSIVIVGGGVFGASAALELVRREHRVTLLDGGPLPHPRASSTDISKLVRMDYGSDGFWVELAERALEGWRRWRREGVGAPGGGPSLDDPTPKTASAAAARDAEAGPLFHETGLLVLAGEPMRAGGFEHDSWALLTDRGHPLERLSAENIPRRFPAWTPGRYAEGYLNRAAGWVESGRVVAALLSAAAAGGVELLEGTAFGSLLERGSRVAGVRTGDGGEVRGDVVLACAGAWTPLLLPWLEGVMRPTAQPVLHFRPERPEPWRSDRFPPWCADIARTGWYGFPLHPRGVVKVGHHGTGWRADPARHAAGESHALPPRTEERFRDFLSGSLPDLADAPVAEARVCLYCDTADGDFWIGRDPEREGLVVAAGGSGHGFKFAPILGPLIADAVEGRQRAEAERLGWRARSAVRAEQARSSR